MSDISSVQSNGSANGASRASETAAVRRAELRGGSEAAERAVQRDSDSVEVSPIATWLSELRATPGSDDAEIRQGLVDEIRQQIRDGEYDVDAKLDRALDVAIDDAVIDTFLDS